VRHLKNIGGKENVDNNFTYTVRLMSYIIVQTEHVKVQDLSEIDVMVDEDSERMKTFSSREEAELSLMEEGIFPKNGVFPFNIRIQRVQ
jgi:hypothetical protein|tara:strand:+ start:163 stop:429 length:267 start_codon:yes stop_codon:yes gene_type:complete